MIRRRKFASLYLVGDKNYEKTHNVIPVNCQACHVADIFMYFLPKMDLDGSSQLTIFFSKKEESEQQYQYMHTDSFGVSWYYVDEAEIDRQRKLKKEEQEEYYTKMVDYLKKALIYGHTSRISS